MVPPHQLSAVAQHLVKYTTHAWLSIHAYFASFYRQLLTLLAEAEEFAPDPVEVSVTLEHEDKDGVWQPLQLDMLEILQTQGPFVHEVSVPKAIATNELRLRIQDWPLYYMISLQDLAATNPYGPMLKDSGAFQNAVVIGDVHGADATTDAQVLATHMAHHFALGFDLYLLYVRGSHLIKAVQANPVTASYAAEGKLHIVSLDALQIPQYDGGNREWAAYDPTKLIAYNHAALMLWGERFHLSALDIDEMWSTRDEGTTVNTWFDECFPGSDIISAGRMEVVCSECLKHSESELQHFQRYWDASAPTQILQSFNKVVGSSSDPKSIFNPDEVGQVWLHTPAGLSGSQTAFEAVSDAALDDATLEINQDCVFVVHLRNLFEMRIDNAYTAVDRRHWLVHRHRDSGPHQANRGTVSI